MGLFDIFNSSDQRQAAQDQIAGINAGLTGLQGDYGQGRQALQTNYMAGIQPFMQNFNTGSGGIQTYGDAVGANGPQGNARATQAFYNNPGFGFQQRQGNNAILAQNAATGGTGSGKEATDLSTFNQGLAGTSWNNYVQSLSPYFNLAQTGAAGAGGLYGQLGTNLANLYQGEGNAVYGANTSIGNANANADLAGLNASGNMWNLISGVAGGAASAAGMMSDERAKEDIAPVGELADHQTVYRYRYKGDPRFHIGLIAQEVEDIEPDAVIDNFLGDLKAVDYRKATDYAANLMRFGEPSNDDAPDDYASTLMKMAA
jgi:hypothetical protein